MLRRNLTKWTLVAIVVFAGLALCARSSQAHFHGGWGSSGGGWGSSGGSWGSSGGYYGWYGSSGGYWGSSGGWGSSGSWGHHGGGYYGSCGSSGGSWGSSGGYTMYYGSCGSSGGSWGSSGGTVIYDGAAPAPATPAKPGDSNLPPTPPMPGPGSESAPSPMTGEIYRSLNGSQAALLTVSVPAEAKVFINGNATTSTGTQRQYISRGLKAGNRYTYEVRAEYVKDGQPATDTKAVTLSAGEMAGLAFNFEGNQENPVASGSKAKTKVTLHVPADAKVYLSGRETTSTGQVREFATSKLAPGAEWNDYTVKVVANVDGREVSKEQTITLTGGEDRELSFDFNSDAVASTAAVTR